MRTLPPLLVLSFVLGVPAHADDTQAAATSALVSIRGAAFGTTFHVKLITPDDPNKTTLLARQIAQTVDRLNAQMSLWDQESELSRFNRLASGEWMPVSPATRDVVEAGLRIRDETGGAFDPTVGPLLSLWHFGSGQRPQVAPAAAQIEAARALVGATVDLRGTPAPAIRKSVEGVQLDLNAIAKGYAVDEIAGLVAEVSPQGCMVEVGGEVRTVGTKPDGTAWRIAIEQPTAGRRSADAYVELSDAALATSGDYRNYFEQDGQRFSHTIDPHTGRPISHQLASVSVVADDCMTADAWATALMVLGPEAGYNLASERNIAALFLVRNGSTFASRTTPGFPQLITLPSPMDASWTTFLITGLVFLTAVAGMAIGVIVSNRRLRGSCGGLNGQRDAQGNPMCDACTTPPEECDEFRKQMAASGRIPS